MLDRAQATNSNLVVKNFRVYSVHQEIRDLTIQVPFNPDHVFILNQTPATLYLVRGGQQLPSLAAADLIILPHSYYNFRPKFGGYLYAVHLEYPGGYVDVFPYPQCQIIFAEGYANYALKIFPTPEVMQPLAPLPDPSIVADFAYEDVQATGLIWDFTLDDRGFEPGSLAPLNASYSPGVGWQSLLQPTNVNDDVHIILDTPSGLSGSFTEIGVGYNDGHGSNTTNRQACTLVPPGAECISGGTTSHGAQLFQGALAGVITATELDFRVVNTDPTPPNTGGLITIEYVYLRGTFTSAPEFAEAIDIQVQFTDLSSGDTPVAWLWDFGDGNTSALQNPLHIYAFAGVYTVCLTVFGAFGGSDMLCGLVYVNAVADEVFAFV